VTIEVTANDEEHRYAEIKESGPRIVISFKQMTKQNKHNGQGPQEVNSSPFREFDRRNGPESVHRKITV
jgi:hypothetical protein